MPKIVIDDRETEVPRGTKVIEAAERLGIMVPRFCYHPALGSVGACRVCAVKFLEGPFKGVQMSCMIEAKDGMVVSTTDEEAVDFRMHVIEWLMLNHPHDCPVCDEGGHCLLQDMTVSGGHGIRRYLGKKRTYHDQHLGPLIQHEMNRCIHCYRCSRFYQEFAGYRDLGPMQIGDRTYFGRFGDGTLESPFAGNLVDICPTGVFTDKPARFQGRRWDFQRTPSLCLHCSLGCHTTASARYREMVRLEGRFSEAVNGYFICDRGRFGFSYANLWERPRYARVGGQTVSYGDAVRAAIDRLAEISQEAGPGSVACVGSTRSSLETLAMLTYLCQMQGWPEPVYFIDQVTARKVKRAVSRLTRSVAVSLRQVEQADFVLALGADPVNEAPMLALAMRQARRNGARIAVIDPRPVLLPFDFEHLRPGPDEIDIYASLLVRHAVHRSAAEKLGEAALRYCDAIPETYPLRTELGDIVSELGAELGNSRKPVIVCGTDIVRETTPSVAADQSLLLQADEKEAGLFYLLPGANALGAGLLASGEGSLAGVVEAIEEGVVRALVLVEHTPFWLFPDRGRLERALETLDLLVLLDYLPSRAAEYAHIMIPTQTLYEAGGSFVNQEGRVQLAHAVYPGGSPISQVGGGDHPPRLFRSDIPGGEPAPGWRVLADFASAMAPGGEEVTRERFWEWLTETGTPLGRLPPTHVFPEHGVRLDLAREGENRFCLDSLKRTENQGRRPDGLELILVDWTFGTEELSSHSPYIQEVERDPCLFMHVDDAARLGLSDGGRVAIELDTGTIEVNLCVTENMAEGVIVLPRHRQLEWQKLTVPPVMIRREQITRLDA